jgi:hypothetical protein
LQTPASIPPALGIADSVGLGPNYLKYPYHTVMVQPALTKMVGRHSLSMGYEFRVYRNFNYTPGNGSFSFNRDLTQGPQATTASVTAGEGVATLLLGTPSGGSITLNAGTAAQKTYHGLYFQDNWRLNRKLTLNLGLRWDYEGPMTERYNRLNRGFDSQAPSPIAAQALANYSKNPVAARVDPFNIQGGLLFAGVNGQPRGGFDQVYRAYMPRVGLAYQLRPRTVVRFGYGLFYIPMSDMNTPVTGTFINMPITQSGFSTSTAMTAQQAGIPVNTLSNPFPQGVVQPSGASLGLSTLLGQGISALSSRGKRPHTHQFQFGIQRELPGQILLEIAYAGSRVRNLPVTVPQNWLQPKYLELRDNLTRQVPNPFYGIIQTGTLSQPTVSTQQLLMQYPQFTSVSLGNVPIGSSWYNALQVSTSKRFSHGLLFQANWTWAKLMEQKAYLNNPGEPLARALTAYPYGGNQPFAAVLSGRWEVPFGTKKKYGGSLPKPVTYALGNWELGGVVSQISGQVLALSSALQTRPIQKVTPTEQRWFDTGAFTILPPYTLRTLPLAVSQITSDGVHQWNLTVAKNFPITERFKFRFQTEFINAFNHTQFGPPNMSVASTTFGQVTSQQNNPRRILFYGKLTF